MLPADAIAALHRSLKAGGELIKVRREGAPAVEVDVMAIWRPAGSTDLTTGTAQTSGRLILSPAHLAAKGYPDAGKKGDRVFIQGRPRTVEEVATRAIGSTLVRIELVVKG